MPILIWGFFLSNFPRAARTVKRVAREEKGAVGVWNWMDKVDGLVRKEEVRMSFLEFGREKAQLGLGFEGFMRFIDEEDRAEIAILVQEKKRGGRDLGEINKEIVYL